MAHGFLGRNTRPPDDLRCRPLKESSKRTEKELHEQSSDEREDGNYKIPYGYLILKALMFFLFGLFAGLLLKLSKGI